MALARAFVPVPGAPFVSALLPVSQFFVGSHVGHPTNPPSLNPHQGSLVSNNKQTLFPRDCGQVKAQLKLELGMSYLDCSPSLEDGRTGSRNANDIPSYRNPQKGL
ncbi:hypothetical protein SADUNF_Sadunf17G0018600 [Salix dunnii]|uniref:Uncharacterized protein n=1 Tax=Salix dunnii TaxID=1413687 RepID=A0A835MMW6_9ROSI|nr:hypothetical protein SADUNF_Sadunf17G0018600 [Salix dunnii]